jgi:class 3 adenylate cyclase
LEIVEAMPGAGQGVNLPKFVIGIHTGVVVVGSRRRPREAAKQLDLGENANLAARIHRLKLSRNTVVVSAATQRLIKGQFVI